MYLIEELKCSPGCRGQWGRSPFHYACGENGNLAIVKYLVEKHGCDPSGKDDNGDTPLNVAALSGRLDILMCLIDERKCSPGCRDMHDHTPNLGDLMNDVAAVIPTKWRLVGVQLKLPNGTLDEIQAQNAGRPDQCILSFEQLLEK
ncbi:hypothetical protein EMCRGX_G016178 [Ephydatia muelleri]